ncbi:adenosylcobinamide-phosphate synthase CbiB [Lichenihabitans sp. PAMC28606]|uniref:adenosylcobinamide-phosphate synthase CbiB n=1 Tax=Lichenihabitans sp. PAMC28606 TaxID=2880932 RepID=UPI0039B3FE7C
MMFEPTLPVTCAALAIEAAFGYPDVVYRSIGHPVTWMGALIGWLDRHLNQSNASFAKRRTAGVAALILLLGATGVVTGLVVAVVPGGWAGFVLVVILCASLPAQRSLDTHVRAVASALETGGLAAGRSAVSMIVGRNPETLDEAAVARAAIESLAENFSDGVVAPTFWMAVAGLPGAALYKAANTADSMIGHRNDRYAAFGWAAARFDDLVNLPASRLSALWLVLAAALTGQDAAEASRAVFRDARQHRSPNAGWPEAAMAGALGLRLGGPRVYGADLIADGYMGAGRADANAADIRRALRLYRVACGVQYAVLLMLALIARG